MQTGRKTRIVPKIMNANKSWERARQECLILSVSRQPYLIFSRQLSKEIIFS